MILQAACNTVCRRKFMIQTGDVSNVSHPPIPRHPGGQAPLKIWPVCSFPGVTTVQSLQACCSCCVLLRTSLPVKASIPPVGTTSNATIHLHSTPVYQYCCSLLRSTGEQTANKLGYKPNALMIRRTHISCIAAAHGPIRLDQA